MVAALTHSADKHFHLLGYISPRKFDGWDGDVFQAYRSTACVTNKVNVIVMVLSTGTVVFTQRVTYRIIRSRYAMYDPFFQKCLQGPVNGYAVKFFTSPSFDIAMRKGAVLLQKELQDLSAATGHAQVIFFQQLVYFLFDHILRRICVLKYAHIRQKRLMIVEL
jgi:hypothetical protein